MTEFHRIKVGNRLITSIDWEMNPSLTFGTYESWGGRERVRNNNEMVYYFFIDGWDEEPKLCLMERAVKHARILAEIDAPKELIQRCIDNQGKVALFEKSFHIDASVKEWLIANVLGEGGDQSLVKPVVEEDEVEWMGEPLPAADSVRLDGDPILLPAEAKIINDDDIDDVIRSCNFFDCEINPDGRFDNLLTAGESREVVIDLRTRLMWQRGGLDINSIRAIQRQVKEVNSRSLAGFSDWRLPSLEEAMSLMETEKNSKGLYLHPCFHRLQAFIFVNATRKPGGFWFVDFKQGRAFWSSGTIPGGFGRLVRRL